jgi:hypothetical protein
MTLLTLSLQCGLNFRWLPPNRTLRAAAEAAGVSVI